MTHFNSQLEQSKQVELRADLIRSLHLSATELVMALAGGGSLVLGDLLTIPGGSRTMIEAMIPYSEESLSHYIGRVPEQFCCQRTARYLAMTAFHRGIQHLQAKKTAAEQRLPHTVVSVPHPIKTRAFDVSHDWDDSRFYIDLRTKPATTAEEEWGHLMGIGCTATLSTNRVKKGEYRVHVAIQTLHRTIVFSLQLKKGIRSRYEEERLLADLILNAIQTTRDAAEQSPSQDVESRDRDLSSPARVLPFSPPRQPICPIFSDGTSDDFPLEQTIPLELHDGETIHGKQTVASQPLIDLFFGNTQAVLWQHDQIVYSKPRQELPTAQREVFNPQAEFTQAIFPGSFNPIHQGHLEIIDIAEQRLGNRITLEISIQNVGKPPLDYQELQHRLAEIAKADLDQAVWLTQTPLFEDKSQLFRESMFVVGTDTLRRFADLRFYHESIHQLHDVLRQIAYHNCRFLVFARKNKEGYMETLENISIPDMLRSLCDEVPEAEFAMEISSSDLRRKEC